MLGTRTQGGRMVGADESTELWQHPDIRCLPRLEDVNRYLDLHLLEESESFLNGPTTGLFSIYFWSSQTNNTIFITNQYDKMSIQYMVPGFELTTS